MRDKHPSREQNVRFSRQTYKNNSHYPWQVGFCKLKPVSGADLNELGGGDKHPFHEQNLRFLRQTYKENSHSRSEDERFTTQIDKDRRNRIETRKTRRNIEKSDSIDKVV